MDRPWQERNVPRLDGKLAVITGANSGIGYEAAKVLAGHGAHVILAVRDQVKGQVAQASIQQQHPAAQVEVMGLDVADLESVRGFSEAFRSRFSTLPLLINNAGVMAPPYRTTRDGFELQFGTNHLGHFALTGLLWPTLLATPGARVVTVASAAHHSGRIDFTNLDAAQGYRRWRFYCQSKLANLLFAYELQRKVWAAGVNLMSVACHPGFAATNLTAAGMGRVAGLLANLAAQSAVMGALPTLYAATEPSVEGGSYIGPARGMRGYPTRVLSSGRSHDEEVAAHLWTVSEELTGVKFIGV